MIAKIKESASNTYILSSTYNLDVIDPPPPTFTPTPTIPLPTNTPVPTNIPTLTPTPKPSLTPVITPTVEPTIEVVTPTGQVLGYTETSPVTQNNIKTNYIPHILVGIGSLLLLVPLLVAKLGR